MFRRPSTPREVLVSALALLTAVIGVVTIAVGYSQTPAVEVIQVLAVIGLGALVIGGAIVLTLVRLADWKTPEDDFERIVRRTERLASDDPLTYEDFEDESDYGADDEDDFDLTNEEDFNALVHSAVDDLPLEFHRVLEHVAIVVTDGGSRVRAGHGRRVYGLYEGDAVTQDYFHDRILLFRDRLLRDFGHDSDLLREQILLTVRRELSDHLGRDGKGVRRP